MPTTFAFIPTDPRRQPILYDVSQSPDSRWGSTFRDGQAEIDEVVFYPNPQNSNLSWSFRTHPKGQGVCLLNKDSAAGGAYLTVTLPQFSLHGSTVWTNKTIIRFVPSVLSAPNSVAMRWNNDQNNDDKNIVDCTPTGSTPFAYFQGIVNETSSSLDPLICTWEKASNLLHLFVLQISVKAVKCVLDIPERDFHSQRDQGNPTILHPFFQDRNELWGKWRIRQPMQPPFFPAFWEEAAGRYFNAILQVQGGEAESILPTFQSFSEIDPGPIYLSCEAEAIFEHNDQQPAQSTLALDQSKLAIIEIGPLFPTNHPGPASISVNGRLQFPLFKVCAIAPDGQTPQDLEIDSMTCTIPALHDDDAEIGTIPNQLSIAITAIQKTQQGNPLAQTILDGALKMILGGEVDLENDDPQIALSLKNSTVGGLWYCPLDQIDDFLRPGNCLIEVSVKRLQLPVSSVGPGSQDPVPTDQYLAADQRPPPAILLPYYAQPAQKSAPGNDGTSPYRLLLNETSRAGITRSLTVELFQDGGTPPGARALQSWVVIDPAPFFVARVVFAKMSATHPEENNLLAVRTTADTDGASWQIQGIDPLLTVILPPQGVGEQMIRGQDTPANKGLIDFRYTPVAILKFENSELIKSYFEPVWNLRRRFGWPGQVLPGSKVNNLDFELLYGLGCNLVTTGLYVSELLSRSGGTPQPPDSVLPWLYDSAQASRFQKFVANQYVRLNQIRSRPATLEVWHEEQPEGLALECHTADYGSILNAADESSSTPNLLTLPNSTALKFFLRFGLDSSGLLYGAQVAFPLANAQKFPEADLQKLADITTPAQNPTLLHGGATWGIEVSGYYRTLWNENKARTSVAGFIEDLFFTSLGGYGHQKASFSTLTIESKISAGRTHFYLVEVLGRIGVFWNKAKHVIVYERVAGRAQQFSETGDPNNPNASHDPEAQVELAGQPILRKVREYIEILEPKRSYPDLKVEGDGDVVGAAFISACIFKDKIIPVKSSWAEDLQAHGQTVDGGKVGTRSGSQIPLWQKGANPYIYPRPQVELEIIVDGTNETTATVPIEEPEKLCFFTEGPLTPDLVGGAPQQDVEPPPDVYSWLPFPWVDYADLPSPVSPEQSSGDPQNPDLKLLDAEEVEPGFGPFTFKVSAADSPASVASRRLNNPQLMATVQNVTMMRSPKATPSAAEAGSVSSSTAIQNAVTALNICRNLLSPVNDPNLNAVQAALSNKDVNGVKAGLNTFATTLTNGAQNGFNDIRNLFRKVSNASPAPTGLLPSPANLLTDPVAYLLWTAANVIAGDFSATTKKFISDIYSQVVAQCQVANVDVNDVGRFIDTQIALARSSWTHLEGMLDSVLQQPTKGLANVLAQLEQDLQDALSLPDDWIDQLEDQLRNATQDFATRQVQANQILLAQSQAVSGVFTSLIKITDNAITTLGNFALPSTPPNPSDWIVTTTDSLSQLKVDLAAAQSAVAAIFQQVLAQVGQVAAAGDAAVAQADAALEDLRGAFEQQEQSFLAEIRGKIADIQSAFHDEVQSVVDAVADQESKFDHFLFDVTTQLTTWRAAITANTAGILATIVPQAHAIETAALATVDNELTDLLKIPVLQNSPQNGTVTNEIFELSAWLKNQLGLPSFDPAAAQHITDLGTFFQNRPNFTNLGNALNGAAPDWDKATSYFDQLIPEARSAFGSAAGSLLESTSVFAQKVDNVAGFIADGDQSIQLVRSLCGSLNAPGLGFNRDTVALFFAGNLPDQTLGMTRCLARVKDLTSDLQALGLRVPTNAIASLKRAGEDLAENLIQPLQNELSNFDFGKILSNLGGIDFDHLVPGLKMPTDFAKALVITHGFDQPNHRIWVKADINPPYKLFDNTTLFSLGPVAVNLRDATVTAHVDIEASMEGQTQKTASGQLTGNWDMIVGGTPMVTFRDTSVNFTNGRITFDLKPANIQLNGVLQVVSDALADLSPFVGGDDDDGDDDDDDSDDGDDKTGFTVGEVKVGEIPVGVRASLELPTLNAAGGTSGITGLQLGAYFELRALNDNLDLDFSIATGFHLSRKDDPFNIMIFILGGAGWVELDLYYSPSSGGMTVSLDLGIEASAALAIDFGPISGSVAIYFGASADYTKRSGEAGSLALSIILLIRGEMDVLGIATVSVELLLELTYDSPVLIGYGEIDISIRICWCFTLHVSQSVTYKFGSPGGQQQSTSSSSNQASLPSSFTTSDAASAYVDHLT